MANGTKDALASALRQMMKVKPIDRITVKDIVEICGVNRQTFYYHFDDVDDLLEWVFEDDAERVLPKEVIYDHWLEGGGGKRSVFDLKHLSFPWQVPAPGPAPLPPE